ncbi:MAG: hypothetical protein V4556_05555 [Bacteroidota bacterium]
MKRIISIFLTLFIISIHASAQPKVTLKKTLELKMPKTVDDADCGTRGASVTWHPIQKKYYASFAGNMSYPFGVFDVKGKRLSSDDLNAMIDLRGLWYNTSTKKISGNAYDNLGWFSYTLNDKGIVEKNTIDLEYDYDEYNLPEPQNVGAYDTAAKKVVFLYKSGVDYYNEDGYYAYSTDNKPIHFGKKTFTTSDVDSTTTPYAYNYTTVIYTGIKKADVGFLNVDNKQIELYDSKTGLLTKILVLPKDAAVEASFNFAYANGIYWLFNIEKRTWIGYK